jgi:acyl-coenzyme A thioesterase 13
MDDLIDTSQIAGNASDDIKRTIGNPNRFFQRLRGNRVKDSDPSSPMFADSILKRMKTVEISLNRKAEEEKKMEARVVVELDVTEGQYMGLNPFHSVLKSLLLSALDMLNGGGSFHGGCSAYLVDV